MLSLFRKGIVGILPVYAGSGDSTLVYTRDTEPLLMDMSQRVFLKNVFEFLTVDMLAIRNRFRKYNVHQNAPIVLAGKAFMKVRVRRPLVKGDGAYGYVSVDYVRSIIPDKREVEIELKNGQRIKSLDSYATLAKNFCMAVFLQNVLVDEEISPR